MAQGNLLEEITVETTTPDLLAYPLRRFTVDEYARMEEAGILAEDERLELIDGCIVVREPSSPPHAGHTRRLTHFFYGRLGDRVLLSVQDSFRINLYNLPEPDVALLRPRDDFYSTEHPGPEDVFLLVEVALTSLRADQKTKVPLYARAGVPEFWILNLPEKLVEVYREPSEAGYRRILKLGPGEPLSVGAFSDVMFSVSDVLA